MTERQKKFMIRLMTDRVVDRFFAELSKKIDNAPKASVKTEICFVTCDDCKNKN